MLANVILPLHNLTMYYMIIKLIITYMLISLSQANFILWDQFVNTDVNLSDIKINLLNYKTVPPSLPPFNFHSYFI